jgi:cell division transport system permease protein
LVSFQDQLASYAADLLKDAELMKFIPESLQVRLSDTVGVSAQLETLQTLSEELKKDDVVEEVSFGQEWVRTYSVIVHALSDMGLWVVGLLIAASLFVISNAISSSIQQRRQEIEVLELVGASKKFVRLPFLAEGLFVGGASGILAVVLLAAGFSAVREAFQSQIAFLQLSSHLHFFSIGRVALFIVAAMAMGALSAQLSLRKLNDGWAASRASKDS